jgi:RNA polymerase sigma-70 factor (ECF subfamily)
MDVEQSLAETVRTEGAAVLATLIRWTGDLSVAEEAVQEASIAALRDWPRSGVPDSPRAWLITAARRKAVDLLRREGARRDKEREGAELMDLRRPDPLPDTVLADDLLRLLFTCAHPSLAPEAQLALALRTLCGLSLSEIAAVQLTSEAAIAKRITRTKQKITVAQIPYRVPPDAELPDRLPVVGTMIHALYTTGHAPGDGADIVRVDLCDEGVRLARLLMTLLPDESLPASLLALLLLTEARRPARVDPWGEVVVLADQDRTRWDHEMIAEGSTLLARTLWRTEGWADVYQLQAAIALEHDRADSYGATDWAEITRLYDLLLSVAPSSSASLARAVAVAERDGPEWGLAALEDLPSSARVEAVRAELLSRTGRRADAVAALDRSLTEPSTQPERRYRIRRRSELSGEARAASALVPGHQPGAPEGVEEQVEAEDRR